MKKMAGLALMTVSLAACATTMQDGASSPGAMEGACANDPVSGFVGQKATAETGAAMLRASSAKTLRWGGPGMAMTMDFRADRLTVSYDEGMTITSARCG